MYIYGPRALVDGVHCYVDRLEHFDWFRGVDDSYHHSAHAFI